MYCLQRTMHRLSSECATGAYGLCNGIVNGFNGCLICDAYVVDYMFIKGVEGCSRKEPEV